MLSPKSPRKPHSPNAKPDPSNRSPNPRAPSPNPQGSNFKPKTLNELKPLKPSQKSQRSKSPSSRHERSFSTIYSKFMQHKCYEDIHELGYSAAEIKEAVNYIFGKYDTNRDGLLDRAEVKQLIAASLAHMGSTHSPSELEIAEFIYAMDKNNDGKLSKQELENAFKRANRIEY